MLDILMLRKDLASVVARLQTRKNPQPYLNVAAFEALETERKAIQTRTEALQSTRNRLSKQIGMLMGQGEKDAAEAAKGEVSALKGELDASAERLEQIQHELQAVLAAVPNLPHASVPVGADEHANVEVRRWVRRAPSASPPRTTSIWARRWGWTSTPPPSSPGRALP